jgi:hypothetical protein
MRINIIVLSVILFCYSAPALAALSDGSPFAKMILNSYQSENAPLLPVTTDDVGPHYYVPESSSFSSIHREKFFCVVGTFVLCMVYYSYEWLFAPQFVES